MGKPLVVEPADPVKPGACLHPKMLRLADLILPHAPGLSGAYATDVARARMDDLWNWFWGRYVKGEFRDGRLTGMGPAGLSQAARWMFDPTPFVDALVAAGFLERSHDGILRVHDHEDHIPGWVRQSLKDASRGSARGKSTGDARGGAPVDSPVRSMESLSLFSSLSSDRISDDSDASHLPVADTNGATKSKPKKLITEQAGLAGDCARLWKARYSDADPPEWGKHIITLNKLGQRHDHARLVVAFGRFVDSDEEFNADKAHHLSLFVANPDKWLIDRSADPMSRLSDKGRRTAEVAKRVVERREREGRSG